MQCARECSRSDARAPVLSPHGALLAVEFVDELVDGALSAAWPAIRAELALSYAQVGLLLGLSRLAGNGAELVLGILADIGWRHSLILGGGVAFALALGVVGTAPGFWMLAAGLALFGPAGAAYVSLSQTALMDLQPSRREKNMARWVVAGWLGGLVGPALVGAALVAGTGWRPAFLAMAALAFGALLASRAVASSSPAPLYPAASVTGTPRGGRLAFWEGLRRTLAAPRRGNVMRWLALLELADLMLDIFRGYLALYLVEVAAADEAVASLGVAALTAAGLAGAAVLVRLLDRLSGLVYLRVSAAGVLLAFPAFLLAPHLGVKLVLAGALGVLTSGWYPVLKAKLYEALPGHSGAAVTLSTLSGMLGGLLPLALGSFAQTFGLGTTMWLLLAGPLALLVGVPRGSAFERWRSA